jgi:hypothetical protein
MCSESREGLEQLQLTGTSIYKLRSPAGSIRSELSISGLPNDLL